MCCDQRRPQFTPVWQNARMPIEAFSPASLRRSPVIKPRHHGVVLLASLVISMLSAPL